MENNRNYELGDTFKHDGKIYKVEHAKENKSCHGCAFCEIDGSRCTLNRVENDVPECIGLHRHDGMDVIFVEETNQSGIKTWAIEKSWEYAKQIYPENKFDGTIRTACVLGFLEGVRQLSEK